ncbi:MAG: hypothetical protein K6A91_05970 [Clostridia bacterium]|nr:hypothetical protein [Clostridia bacterium]
MKRNVFRIIALVLCIGLTLVLTSCDDNKPEGDRPYNANKMEQPEEKEPEPEGPHDPYDPNNGIWEMTGRYVARVTEDIAETDELQKITYSYDAAVSKHTFTMIYEPLDSDTDDETYIPSYTVKVSCICGSIAKEMLPGEVMTVKLEATYDLESEYGAIFARCWLSSDNDLVKVTCNEGYTREEFFAGETANGKHSSMTATFTVSMPTENIKDVETFSLLFESSAGVSSYDFQWVPYKI